jgi:hypothetical protein
MPAEALREQEAAEREIAAELAVNRGIANSEIMGGPPMYPNSIAQKRRGGKRRMRKTGVGFQFMNSRRP